MKLLIIFASTREGRQGLPVATWFNNYAASSQLFNEVAFVDLQDLNLPLLDEPHHPKAENYQHEHTKNWSTIVRQADAIVFVTPEYNYFAPATLINAFDYLYNEWNYKPMGFVSYGGISGGLRAVQSVKSMVTTAKVLPIPEGVSAAYFEKQINENGDFIATEGQEEGATAMLRELEKIATALQPLRVSE